MLIIHDSAAASRRPLRAVCRRIKPDSWRGGLPLHEGVDEGRALTHSSSDQFDGFLRAPTGSDSHAPIPDEPVHADSDTYVQQEDQRLIGQHRLARWPHRSISVWLGSPDHQPNNAPDVEERMLRYGFQARTGDLLTPMLSEDYGVGIGIPLWTGTDPLHLDRLIASLHMDLRLLIAGRPLNPDAVDSLTNDLLTSALSSHFPMGHLPSKANRSALKKLCADHHIDNFPQGQNFIEFLFDDLPVRLHGHPYLPCVLFDFFLMDACALQGSMRGLLMQTLLALNQNSGQFSSMSVGLDNRHFIVATAYASIDELHHHFQPLLERWVELAFDIRGLCKTLVLEGATMEFEVSPGNQGVME